MHATRICLASCALAALATPALADDDDVAPVSDAPDGQYSVRRGLQSPAGMISARVLLDINLAADRGGEPISLAPDIFFGVTDRFQIGVVHQGPKGWQTPPGPGLCLTGEDGGCPDGVYDNIGLDVMYGLAFEQLHMSLHSSVFVPTFDPFESNLALGVAAKAHLSPHAAVFLDPKIAIALTDRDIQDDAFYMPVEIAYQVGAQTTFKLLTGLFGGLSRFGDTYEIPVGIGVVRNLNEHFDLGARFSFDNLLGAQPEGVGRGDERSLAILVNIRS